MVHTKEEKFREREIVKEREREGEGERERESLIKKVKEG